MATNLRRHVVVLATGGTISGLSADASDNISYTAGQVGVQQLLAAVPSLAQAPFDLEAEQLAQLDSKDMDFATWRLLAQRCAFHLARTDVAGVVVTHGTDTMEETAYFLDLVLSAGGALDKPVVLTGAMRPASALVPDGPQNLLDATAVAACAVVCGVVVVFAGAIHTAVDVQKVHTYRLDAFDSGDAGALGYVEEGVVRMAHPSGRWALPAREAEAGHPGATSALLDLPWPRVEIVLSHAGASPAVVDAMLAHAGGLEGPVRGVVVAGTGNGSVHHLLEEALLRARARGIPVLRASRCTAGRVLGHADDVLPGSNGLSAPKARIALMLSLMGLPSATAVVGRAAQD